MWARRFSTTRLWSKVSQQIIAEILIIDIADAPIGPLSTLYTEPSFLDACQYEFEADTECVISIAEKLVIPYEWSTYDVLRSRAAEIIPLRRHGESQFGHRDANFDCRG